MQINISAKINNSQKAIKRFECKQRPEKIYQSYISFLELTVSPKDKEKNLITIETCYKMKLNSDKYGFYDFRLYLGGEGEGRNLKTSSFSFIIDDNYMLCHNYGFDEISKYKLYSFNNSGVSIKLKDKRIKINIENEFNKEFLSKFNAEEIKQINNSLNKIKYEYDSRHLIYQKVIHNIKDKKDYIKAYFIVFYPHTDSSGSYGGPSTCEQPIIVKKFTINNLLVKNQKECRESILEYENVENEEENLNEEENKSEEKPNDEEIEMYENGDYVSDHDNWIFFND